MKSHPSVVGLTVLMILMVVGSSGCDTSGPIARIPSVIIYQAGNETRVFVTGDEYMYEGINITIENKSRIENYTYGLTHNSTLTHFRLEVRVSDNEGDARHPEYTYYIYSASLRVERDEDDDDVTFKISDIHHENEVSRTPPYRTIMEKTT